MQGIRITFGPHEIVVTDIYDQSRKTGPRVAQEILDLAGAQQAVNISRAAAPDANDMKTMGPVRCLGIVGFRVCHVRASLFSALRPRSRYPFHRPPQKRIGLGSDDISGPSTVGHL